MVLARTGASASEGSTFSVQVEVDLDRNRNRHRMPVFHRRLKLPILHGLNRFFVEAHAQAGLNTNLAGPSIGAHDQRQRADSLELCLARFFREFRLRLINHSRRGDSSTDADYASAGAAAFSRTQSRPFAFHYAAATASHLRLRRLERGQFVRSNQRHGNLRPRAGHHNVASNQRSSHNDSRQQDVNSGGTERAILFVIVETPDVFNRSRLRLELEWRQFFRKEEFIELAKQRAVQRLFELLVGDEQVKLRLRSGASRIQLFGSHIPSSRYLLPCAEKSY